MKRIGHLFEKIISDDNLLLAIENVNKTHRWYKNHIPNRCTAWVELTKPLRVIDLRKIICESFNPGRKRVSRIYDVSADKERDITEPQQYPDQYIHHALIQVLEPVLMRGMDRYCCGSIPGRGAIEAKQSIERWVQKHPKESKYCLACDIRHFYDSLKPDVVLNRLKKLIKDHHVLSLVEKIIQDGIEIGSFPSQWFANTVLQPLDRLIRDSHLCSYYERYLDNMTIFAPNKRNLHKLRKLISEWLSNHCLKLKYDWQVFPIYKYRRNGEIKKRLPMAVGYRYGRTYTIPRKRNLLRMKRFARKAIKRLKINQFIPQKSAASLMSRLGQLKQCNNHNLYKLLYQGHKLVKYLRNIIRYHAKKKKLEWKEFLEIVENKKHYAYNTQRILKSIEQGEMI